MKVILFGLCAFLSSWSATVGCGDSGGMEAPAPTLQQVRDGAVEALSGEGVVHITEKELFNGEWFTFEKWLDLEEGNARIELDGEVVEVVSGGQVTEIENGRLNQMPAWEPGHLPDELAMLFHASPHLRILAMANGDEDVERVELNGRTAIKVEVQSKDSELNDLEAASTILYLDEGFAPLRIERPSSPSSVTEYGGITYVAKETLPADYFSLDALGDTRQRALGWFQVGP